MASSTMTASPGAYDLHQQRSRDAQWRADKWMMTGVFFMGTAVLGLIGLPFFLRGLVLQIRAERAGFTVRPIMVTLIGYLVAVDSALNSLGWALDLIGNHTLLARVFLMAWGNMFDGGYFWHYNELWIGGAARPARSRGWSRCCR
ncbi:MAG TPA: hypothetical protein VFM56_00370 [Solimonas sp.]|nr:hypothetical protein [Solimonas sp.]